MSQALFTTGWPLLLLGGTVLVLLTVSLTLELVLVTVGSLLRAPRSSGADRRRARRCRLAALVPAHNEEGHIARCVKSLQASAGPAGVEVLVVADNCTDHTAEQAAKAGATVARREDDRERGKGYALQLGFELLTARGFDAFLIIDADSTVSSTCVRDVGRLVDEGADAVQCRYEVNNPEAGYRARLMQVAFLAINVLRPLGRSRLGLSAGILGNGYAVTADTLKRVPQAAYSVVEDLEYHLHLVRAGLRVRFCESATVRADMPVAGDGVATQRARWEGGRFLMMRTWAPRLVKLVALGRWRLAEPLLDLAGLPLAQHVVLLGILMALPFNPFRIYAAASLLVMVAYVLRALTLGESFRSGLVALAWAPVYVLWKVLVSAKIVRASSADMPWIRTERRTVGNP